jgi:hypothetical protein
MIAPALTMPEAVVIAAALVCWTVFVIARGLGGG